MFFEINILSYVLIPIAKCAQSSAEALPETPTGALPGVLSEALVKALPKAPTGALSGALAGVWLELWSQLWLRAKLNF